MPRKKKLDTESPQEIEAVNEEKAGATAELESEEKDLESMQKETVEKAEAKKAPEAKADEEEPENAEKPRKKREKKRLSESELKRVMTDTKETLVPLTDYIACSVHLGTKVITPDMKKFVYKRRADGLAVMNTHLIDEKIREAAKFLSNFAPEDVFISGKRDAVWPAIERFSEATGIRAFTKKYPAGIITNIRLETFFEPKLAIICDPWVDKNALHDSNIVGIPVIGLCDTNNYANGVKQVMVGNNKSRKAVGIILFILAREYLKALGKEEEAKALRMEEFTGKIETPAEILEAKAERRAKAYEADAEKIDSETGRGSGEKEATSVAEEAREGV